MAKAPIRSLYRKILAVLNESQHGGNLTVEQLIKALETKSPLEFTYYSADSKGRVSVKPCSRSRIQDVVELCIDLNLLKFSSGQLSKHGIKAIESGKFDSELRKRLYESLEGIGASSELIDKTVREILSSANEQFLPTWEQVFKQIPSCQDKKKFQTYVGLLTTCGGLGFTRKKLLIPHNGKSK